MQNRKVSATEAARNFSDLIGQVRYQAASFDVVKGKEVVARIVPAGPSAPTTLGEQARQLAGGAHLAAEDVASYAADVAEALGQLSLGDSEWD
jgi:hypothetical protein